MAIPAEVLERVKLIELNTRKKVNNLFSGEYHTVFKGQGMTFAEFREYVPGDDVRTISWVVTARTSKTHVKQFEEERELSVLLLVDISASLNFGSQVLLKAEIASYVSAVLAMSAVKNKDQVGIVLFSDRVEHYVKPAKGRNQVLRLLRDLEYHKPSSKKSDIRPALIHALKVLKKRSLVFIISDFLSMPVFTEELKPLAQKHDLVALHIEDPWEQQWPGMGLIELQDQETGEVLLVDTDEYDFSQQFKLFVEESKKQRDRILKSNRIDQVTIPTDESWDQSLIQFFKQRRQRGR